MDDKKQLGREIRRARRELGLNQTQLAKKAGTRQMTVSSVENGASVNLDLLQRILKPLGLDTLPMQPASRS